MITSPGTIADAVYREITRQADGLLDTLDVLSGLDDTYRATGLKRYQRLAVDYADEALARLRDITSLDRSDLRRSLFFAQLSSRPRTGIPLEAPEDALNIVSKYTGTTLYTVRGKGGIEDILESERIPELKQPPLALPNEFNDGSLSPLSSYPLEALEQELLSLPAGPDLFDHRIPYDHDHLSFARYPRMDFALRAIIGALCSVRGASPSELTMVEYGPRLAIGAMIAAARMSVNVQWRDIKPQNSFHTMQEIARLPDSLRSRITTRDDAPTLAIDCAVWNYPWTVPFEEMSRDVAHGGTMVIQTELKIDAVPRHGWTPLVHVRISDGSYVLPSAYLYVINGRPSHFQIWQRAFV